jgi:serine/threonine protein kinase
MDPGAIIANELMLMRKMMEDSERRHNEEKLRMQQQIDNLASMVGQQYPAGPGLGPGAPNSPHHGTGPSSPGSFLSRNSSSAMPLFRALSNSSARNSLAGGGGRGSSNSPENNSGGSVPGLPMQSIHSFGGSHAPHFAGTRHRTSTLEDDIPISLMIAKEDIQLLGLIGRGSFGEVWRALYKSQVVAVKVFLSEESDVSSEVKMMCAAANHKNIIPLVGVVIQSDPYNDPQVAIVTKYMSNGSLHDMLVNDQSANYHGRSLPLLDLISMSVAAASGVQSLHSRGIIHRDLACRNLLVDEVMNVCVCDFGFARLRPAGKGFTATNLGPVRWEAPESLKNKEYGEKTDVFSFGVCLYEMFSGKEPFVGSTNAAVAYKVLSGERMRIPISVDPVVAAIMTSCWAPNPEVRPTIREVYKQLKEQHHTLQNAERDYQTDNDIISRLKAGCLFVKVPFHKIGINNKGKARFFTVDDDLRRLVWVQGRDLGRISKAIGMKIDKQKMVRFEDIVSINVGATTPNFQRFYGEDPKIEPSQPKAAFSIMTKDRSIDVICPNIEIMNEWVRGLNMLIGRFTLNPAATPSVRNCFVSIGGDGAKVDVITAIKRYQTSPQEYNHEEILHLKRVVVGQMMLGDHFLKYRHMGKPHERFFRIHRDIQTIYWSGGEKQNKNKTLSLMDVVEVRKDFSPVGLGEDSVEKGESKKVNIKGVTIKSNLVAGAAKKVADSRDYNPKDTEYCFSLINDEGERVLSLICPNKNSFDLWTFGFNCVLEELDETGIRNIEDVAEEKKEKKRENTYMKRFNLRRKSSSSKRLMRGNQSSKELGGEEKKNSVEPEPDSDRSDMLTPNATPSSTPGSTPGSTPAISRNNSNDRFYDNFSASSFGGASANSFSDDDGGTGAHAADNDDSEADAEFFNSERKDSSRAETHKGRAGSQEASPVSRSAHIGLRNMLRKTGIR